MALTLHSLFDTVGGLVAVGTLLLAAGTLGLAWVTRKTAVRTAELAAATMKLAQSTEREVEAVVAQADAARQEVEVSRAAFIATYRPRLINVPLGLYVHESGGPLGMSFSWDEGSIEVTARDDRQGPSERSSSFRLETWALALP